MTIGSPYTEEDRDYDMIKGTIIAGSLPAWIIVRENETKKEYELVIDYQSDTDLSEGGEVFFGVFAGQTIITRTLDEFKSIMTLIGG